MSPFNPDKFRLDSTSAGGINSSIDRKIEKLSKKCAELIQKNKHKDAKKILSEIKELKALRLPDEDFSFGANSTNDQEKTLVTTPMLQMPDSDTNNQFLDLEKTLATTPLTLDQESTIVSPAQEIQQIPPELDKTVVTMPFNPENINMVTNERQASPVDTPLNARTESESGSKPTINVNREAVSEITPSKEKNKSTIIGIVTCVLTFFVMAVFSFLAFKDFPGKGNYFDWLRAESIYQKADTERNEGRFDEARSHYLEANQIYPELAKSANARGQIQILEGNVQAALQDLKDAAMHNPKNSRYQRDYANALRLNGEGVKAIEILTALITKEPAAAQNKALLALIQLQLKQPEAENIYNEATANTNDSNSERDYYAGLYKRIEGDLEASIQFFKSANKAEPLNVVILSELINAKELNHEDATQEASDLTKLAPKWVKAWVIFAKQIEAQKRFSEAADSYAKAAELDSKNSKGFSRAAKAYLDAGKKSEAKKYAQEGLKLNSKDFDCLEVISQTDDKANPAEMEELYKKALEKDQNNTNGWNGLALWQSKQVGKSLKALESQARAVKLDQKDAASWYQLALFLESFDNKKEAQRAAAEAMSLAPENEKYTQLRMKLMSND